MEDAASRGRALAAVRRMLRAEPIKPGARMWGVEEQRLFTPAESADGWASFVERGPGPGRFMQPEQKRRNEWWKPKPGKRR